MKTIIYLIITLSCCGVLEAQAQEIARPAAVIKLKAEPEWLAFSPDGKLLASTVSGDSTVNLWDTATGAWAATFHGEKGSRRVNENIEIVRTARPIFSPDGHVLVVADFAADEVRLWDVSAGKVKETFKGDWGMGDPVFSPDGHLLALVGMPGLKVWDMGAHQLRSWSPPHVAGVESFVFDPDGQSFWASVISSGLGDSLQHVNLLSGETTIRIVPNDGKPFLFRLSPDGQTVATFDDRAGPLKLWQAATGQLITTVGERKNPAPFPVFSPDGQTLVTIVKEGKINLWKRDAAEVIVSLDGKAGEIARFSPDGKLLATVNSHGVALRDAHTGEQRQLLSGASGPEFSPAGSLMATTGKGGVVSLWRLAPR
jgi:WD40 repeat protein